MKQHNMPASNINPFHLRFALLQYTLYLYIPQIPKLSPRLGGAAGVCFILEHADWRLDTQLDMLYLPIVATCLTWVELLYAGAGKTISVGNS
jgi:hypothetical protein